MAQYIDRVDLVFAMDWDNDIQKWTLTDEKLDEITTITNAAPVVRCKDCEFACDFDDDESAWCKNWNQYVWAEHFCSYGERKDGA